MKRLLLIIGLVIVLAGSLAGGLALHAGAANPNLKITNFNGVVPATITVSGQNWDLAVMPVDLYVDTEDGVHKIAEIANVSSKGAFVKNFPLGSLSIGTHKIIASPGGGDKAEASFIVTARELMNEQTTEALSDIVENANYGLEEIKNEVKNIEFCAPAFTSTYRTVNFSEAISPTILRYASIRHVSLSLKTEGLEEGDSVSLMVHFGPPGGDLFYTDYDEIEHITKNGTYFFQFDTDQWGIDAWDGSGNVAFTFQITTLSSIPQIP
jgi:hypothetical protein